MINKVVGSAEAALADVHDGATVMIGGLGTAGLPNERVDALAARGCHDFTGANNNAGNGHAGLAAPPAANLVRRTVCSFPRRAAGPHFHRLYCAGQIELELVPPGQPCRAYPCRRCWHRRLLHADRRWHRTRQRQEMRPIDSRGYVLQASTQADFALIKAERGDRWRNLIHRVKARNCGPIPIMAARSAVASVHGSGESKIAPNCTCPITGIGCVSRIDPDQAMIDTMPAGLKWGDMAEGSAVDDLQRVTGAPLNLSPTP